MKYGIQNENGEFFTGIRDRVPYVLRWSKKDKWIAEHYQIQLGQGWNVVPYFPPKNGKGEEQ